MLYLTYIWEEEIMDIETVTDLDHAKALLRGREARIEELENHVEKMSKRQRTYLEGFERQKDIAEKNYNRYAVEIAKNLKSQTATAKTQRDIAYVRFKEAKATYDNLEQVILVINSTY
jgi:hypothetical protein